MAPRGEERGWQETGVRIPSDYGPASIIAVTKRAYHLLLVIARVYANGLCHKIKI